MTSPTPAEATPDDDERLVPVAKAAGLLGVSKPYLYQLIKSGGITAVQLPGARGQVGRNTGWGLRIERAEIEAFIERNRVEAT